MYSYEDRKIAVELYIQYRRDAAATVGRLDPIGIPMFVDVGVYEFRLRSSFAWEKKALTLRGIFLACRSALFCASAP